MSDELPRTLPKPPTWARWLAQDADGSWWAYEAEPHAHDGGWYENEVGRYLLLGKTCAQSHWRNSLKAVPTRRRL